MAVNVLNAEARAPMVITCEHASADVPPTYENLGLAPDLLLDHIGWDIGASIVAAELSRRLDAVAILSAASRLLVDCNRSLSDHDLMPQISHGVAIPGNAVIDGGECDRRLARFYRPYHDAIDAALGARECGLLLSVHSFTPSPLGGRERDFDVGILHDDFYDLADLLAAKITGEGFAVRMNEPYSALDGLIFSARDHGRRMAVRYLEIEVNNRLLREDGAARAVAARLAVALRALLVEGPCASS
jgi:predicted N-formylglutamate amidohydrolase